MIKLGQTRKENLTSTFLARITEQATLWSSFQRLHFTKPSASLFDLNHFELHCTNMFPLRLYKKFEVLCKISVFKRKRKLIIALLSQRFFFFVFSWIPMEVIFHYGAPKVSAILLTFGIRCSAVGGPCSQTPKFQRAVMQRLCGSHHK